MDNSSVTAEAGFIQALQYKHNMKASLPRFSRCKFHEHRLACGKDADCWQVLFSKMAILKVKEDMATDCKLIFFI